MTRRSKRRAFLRTAVAATAVGVAGCSDDGAGNGDGDPDEDDEPQQTETATDEGTNETTEPQQTVEEPDAPEEVQNPQEAVDDWLSNTKNYDGTIQDATGTPDITVDVGADDTSGGNFAFAPAAIRVTEGTAVQWQWVDGSSAHNVRERDQLFDSGSPVASSGKTYQVTFEEPGVYLYRCTNHGGALGMRGAVIVEEQQTLSGYTSVDDWLDGYEEYSGRLDDMRGQGSVDVTVGAPSPNGTNHSFDPVAILVDRGTQVVFDWTGRGGAHDVSWEDGNFEDSVSVRDASHTYIVTLDEPGVYRYYCRTDRPNNGRGAIVVR
ncbi:halocyanin domain-containing protein [Halorientalis halophila]|uniref:halocyanin domain-containing protein n=1 Tax=Halorientalis halophila TaxID=3108499 RepID=UPI0030082D47